MTRVVLYVEAVTSGRRGGWGVLLMASGRTKRLWGGADDASVPTMLLVGAARGLAALRRPCRVDVVTTAQYLVRGMEEWVSVWKRSNWMGANGPVAHRELWEALLKEAARHRVRWHWVRRGEGGVGESEARLAASKGLASAGGEGAARRGVKDGPSRVQRPSRVNPFGLLVAAYGLGGGRNGGRRAVA